MSIEVKVPTLPESVTDATVLAWHKQAGDPVSRDENLLDLETDKVVLEVPSPVDGVLQEIRAETGAVVTSDDVLGIIEPGTQKSESVPREGSPSASQTGEKAAEAPAAPESAPSGTPASEPVLTPAVRRLVKELSLDPSKIQGTGKDGRILKSDVMRYLDEQKKREDEEEIKAMIPQAGEQAPARNETRVPMSRLRARIAERLVEAQHTAAILTTFNEVDLSEVIVLRRRYRDSFEKEHGVKLGFMSFFVKATIEALKRFPVVNASVDGTDIVYHDYFDIGIAVGSPRGLVVPILRDADQLSFAEIERRIKQFGQKAQEGTLSYEELTGGTFTISNGGVYGSMLSTPILNPPQSGILGMHNIVERPVVVDGEIVIRPMMYLALSYDHRIIDGREAVQTLVTIKQCLEDPARLMLNL
ncbi:MAG: 2-oxoglutarate dehydrogenase complex dihydrolipoyllysine-residue succinyltransferase [Gammaproteobacteria bacterium]|nr:MAG: 2-oxoglutarate dehydrogenase complex dihydrolipoyllysine-residue succinyltransferase [Gammaproteobacteria bacterium]